MSRRRNTVWVSVLLMTMLACGAASYYFARIWPVQRKLSQVARDWDVLRTGMTSFGMDHCGDDLPSDTTWRSREAPTFDTTLMIHPCAPGGPFSRRTQMLTTPFPYVSHYPTDPFAPDKFYGYAAWSYFDQEPSMAVLYSVGPDGKADISLQRLAAILDAVREPTGRGAVSSQRPEACFRALVKHFLYDPTNGTTSRGDLIQFYSQDCQQAIGFGKWQPGKYKTEMHFSDSEIEDLLARFPEGSGLPFPRYTASLKEGEAFPSLATHWYPVRTSFYNKYRDFLSADEPSSGTDRLDRLSNRMVPFVDFFAEVQPLTAEQTRALDQWRADDPKWWGLIDDPLAYRVYSNDPEAFVTLERYTQFFVFYGKCTMLAAANRYTTGDYKPAWNMAGGIGRDARNLEGMQGAVSPVPPLAERAGKEIGRMAGQLRTLAEEKIPPSERR